jgi:hypothetical protein
LLIFAAPLDASGAHNFFQPLLARLVCLPRAPYPAATGGGFGFGKFRRDEQGGLVQKLVDCVHLSFLVDRIRRLTSVLSPFEAEREKSRFTRRLLQFVLADRKVLYSEASMCPRILSAAAQSWASKSRFEPLDCF